MQDTVSALWVYFCIINEILIQLIILIIFMVLIGQRSWIPNIQMFLLVFNKGHHGIDFWFNGLIIWRDSTAVGFTKDHKDKLLITSSALLRTWMIFSKYFLIGGMPVLHSNVSTIPYFSQNSLSIITVEKHSSYWCL